MSPSDGWEERRENLLARRQRVFTLTKYGGIVSGVVLLLAIITYVALNSFRDMSTPEARLAGDWQLRSDNRVHYAFHPIDEESGTGLLVFHGNTGVSYESSYRIVDDDRITEDGDKTVWVEIVDGFLFGDLSVYSVALDGTTLTMLKSYTASVGQIRARGFDVDPSFSYPVEGPEAMIFDYTGRTGY